MPSLTYAHAAARRIEIRDIATGAAAFAFLLAFFVFRNTFVRFANALPEYVFLLFAASLLAATLFRNIAYTDFPRFFALLARATAAGVLANLLLEPSIFTLSEPERWKLFTYVNWGYWVALASAVAGLWRPSFAFPPALYVLSSRYLSAIFSDVPYTAMDIEYLMEMSELLAASACAVMVLKRVQSTPRGGGGPAGFVDAERFANCMAFAAVGIHLGNYFWSAYAKLTIGPHPWSWPLENQTQNLMLGAIKEGVAPLAAFPTIAQWTFDAFGSTVIIVNIIVLLVQVLAPVAPLRLRWLIGSSLAYDAFHAGTYLIGGLLFWPWIWNNVSILLAARKSTDDEIGWLPKIVCIATLLSGYSFLLAGSTRLGWFDIADIKVPTIQAEAPDGHWVGVPTAFFMSHAYSVARGYLDSERAQGHYPPSVWGAVFGYDRVATSGRCVPPLPVTDPESAAHRRVRLERVKRFLVAHHKQMVRLTSRYGPLLKYIRGQHYPSNPWVFAEFDKLDLSKVRRYRMLTQSVCLSLDNGRLKQRILKQDEVIFDVP